MFIISDFSKTFTRADMPTTWSVFAKSGLLGEAYTAERDALYAANIHFEQEGNIAMTEKWFIEHAKLFVKYGLTEKLIDEIVMDDRYFAPRDGVEEFLEKLKEQNIPLIIVTSGVTNFALRWFELRYDFIPDVLFGTELVIEDGKVVSVIEDSVICPLDKRVEIDFEGHDDEIIILGDSAEDLSVVADYTKSFGFSDESRGFDVTLGKEGNMIDITI